MKQSAHQKFREDGFNYIKIKNVYIVFFIVMILYLISKKIFVYYDANR